MSSTASGYPNGRPAGPECPAIELLEHFEELARTKRRGGKPSLPSRDELAKSLGKTTNSVRNWCHSYNFPWPLFSLNEPVCLIDALPPRFEVLYANQALCDLVGWSRDDLRWQPSAFIQPIERDTPEDLARRLLARELKVGNRESGNIESWLRASDGRGIRVDAELRYGMACDAYYVRLTPLALQLALPATPLQDSLNVVADLYLDANGIRQQGLPPIVHRLS